jgi:autonomous glycyl radical cofactor GrcA
MLRTVRIAGFDEEDMVPVEVVGKIEKRVLGLKIADTVEVL